MGCIIPHQKSIKEQPWKTSMVLNKRWKVEDIVGKGTFGLVCKVIDLRNKRKKYVVKFEKLTGEDDTGRLPQEAQVLETLKKRGFTHHLVEVIDKGNCTLDHVPAQFLIMTLLGPNLQKLQRLCPDRKLSPSCVALIFHQSVEVVQCVHVVGYLHRDIKPGNFVVGRGSNKHEIYLIDFGIARRYLDDNGVRYRKRDVAPHRGTRPFMSVNVHAGIEHSPRDDLWSLFYSMIFLRTGSLPWMHIMRKTMMGRVKKKIIPARWLEDVEPEYMTIHEYLTSLQFDMNINYQYVTRIIRKMMTSLGIDQDFPMDWEVGGAFYFKIDKTELAVLFNEEDSMRE